MKFALKPLKNKVQGCALRKIEGISPILWTCEIQGAQLGISTKKITFPKPKSKSKVPAGATEC